ncbi:hypothetical protein BDV06DRAFT_216464 [Aspergillus oleicola]
MEFDPNRDLLPSSRIDHVGITAPPDQCESLIDIYKKALAPLKYKELMRFPGALGLGVQVPDFWISEAKVDEPQGLHFALVADDQATVYNGKPGLETEYHPNYYAAFTWNSRGNNVEIVCHLPLKE